MSLSDAVLAVPGRKHTQAESCGPASPFTARDPLAGPGHVKGEGVNAWCCGPRSWLSSEMVPPSLLLSPGPRGQRTPLLFCRRGAGTDVGRAPCLRELLSRPGSPLPHCAWNPTINAGQAMLSFPSAAPKMPVLVAGIPITEPLLQAGRQSAARSAQKGRQGGPRAGDLSGEEGV